jgi:hypothetical protein
MKTLAVALLIISLLAAPKVLADELKSPTKSQEEIHESDQAKIHENEPFDDLEDDDIPLIHIATPTPTSTPIGSPTATPVETPTGTPTETPTASPTPTSTPEVQGLEQGQPNGRNGLLGQLSTLLKEIIAYLESLAPKA